MLRNAWNAVCNHNTSIKFWIAAGQQHLCKINGCSGSPLLPAAQQLWTLGSSSGSSSSSSSISETRSKLVDVAHGTRNIRSAAHLTVEAVAERTAAVQAVLVSCDLSYAAAVSVMRCHSKRALQPGPTLDRIRALQDAFGHEHVNLMLASVPDLLFYDTARLVDCFESLVELFGSRALALDVTKKGADLLFHSPVLVEGRMQRLMEMLQVDQNQLMTLVKKLPVILKCKPEGLQPTLDFLCSAGGLTPPEVWKFYLGWPMLATTTVELLQTRYRILQQLLQADDSDMHRLVRSWPAHLVRDPNHMVANLKILSDQMSVPREQLLALIRKEPGILSWNVSTLVTRCVAMSQMLRLPPELRLQLLSHDRSLLSRLRCMPERLQALQQALGVSEDELFPIVHKNLYVVRFPAEAIHAKLACAASLAALHPPWLQEWQQLAQHRTLRVLQVGWGCHWRLVYLLHTGQQHSSSFFTALSNPHAVFLAKFPGFSSWLARFNASVSNSKIPILAYLGGVEVSDGGVNLKGPQVYTSVLASARMGPALHAGSVMVKRPTASRQLPLNSSSSSRLIDLAGLDSEDTTGSACAAAVPVDLPATQAGWLAAWWGLPLDRAQDFLGQQPYMAKRPWANWQARLQALQDFLTAVGWTPATLPAEESNCSSGCTAISRSTTCTSWQSGGTLNTAAGRHNCSSAVDGCSNRSSGSSSTDSVGGEGEFCQDLELPSVAPADSPEQMLLPSAAAALAAAGAEAAAAATIKLRPPPATDAAVRQALATGQGAAVAAVTTACHLAPFACDLVNLPGRPSQAVVELLFAAPALFKAKHLVEHCTKLAALSAASQHLQAELAAASATELAAYITCISPRLRFLQYLVQTQQPYPWKHTLYRILKSQAWYGDKHLGSVREQFSAAYPGYREWEEALETM